VGVRTIKSVMCVRMIVLCIYCVLWVLDDHVVGVRMFQSTMGLMSCILCMLWVLK